MKDKHYYQDLLIYYILFPITNYYSSLKFWLYTSTKRLFFLVCMHILMVKNTHSILRYTTWDNTVYIFLWFNWIKIDSSYFFHNIIVFHHGNTSHILSMYVMFQENYVLIVDTSLP